MRLITKKHISRRTLLRGIGTAVSLPLLDSMVPAQTPLAQTAAAPQIRLGLCFIPHGAVMANWTPIGEGADFEAVPHADSARAVQGSGRRGHKSRAQNGGARRRWR